MATYAMSDIHGEYRLLETVLKTLKKDDKLIFLGDAVDRGPQPISCMRALLEDSRVTYLRGNHEEFLSRFIIALLGNEEGRMMSGYAKNGGKATLIELRECEDKEIIKFLDAIDEMPTYTTYTNPNGQVFHLSHAGYTPGYTEDIDLLWDREHFEDPWCIDENHYVVHGHTPISFICDVIDNWQALQYCDGHKIDIDLAAFYNKKTCLLNLDDLSVTYFEIEYDGDVNWWKEQLYCTDKVHNPRKD